MGCCDFDLTEMRLYQIVAKVKNQYRTQSLCEPVSCHTCGNTVVHEYVRKLRFGFSVRISCPNCGWTFEG